MSNRSSFPASIGMIILFFTTFTLSYPLANNSYNSTTERATNSRYPIIPKVSLKNWNISSVVSRHKPHGKPLETTEFFQYMDYLTSILQVTNCDNKYQVLTKYTSTIPSSGLYYPEDLEPLTSIENGTPDIDLIYIFNAKKPSLMEKDWVQHLLNGKGLLLVDHKYKKIVISCRSDLELADYFTIYRDTASDYWPVVYNKSFWKSIKPKINKDQYNKAHQVYDSEYWGYYWKNMWSYNKVHSGYYSIFNRMFEDIFVQYMKTSSQYPTYKLVIIGHSMGGSIASLTSLTFHHLKIRNQLITFNSPKLWTATLADLYDLLSGTKQLNELSPDIESGYLRVWNTRDSWNLFPPNKGYTGFYYKHSGLSIATEQSALPFSSNGLIIEYDMVGKWDWQWERKNCKAILDAEDFKNSLDWKAHKVLIRDVWACVDIKE